jgi:hypothetical protein
LFTRFTALLRRLLALPVLVVMGTALLVPNATAFAADDAPDAPGVPGFSPGAGLLWESDSDLSRDLDLMSSVGARWLRLDFDWASIEDQRGHYDWANLDRVVAAARSRGLQILALPSYSPVWARPVGTTSHYPPADPTAFAAFAGAAAARYAAVGVHAFEIWNEPNLSMFWSPRPDPSAYARLLVAAAAAVHAADPSATVLSGGLAPATDAADGSEIRPATFLGALYAAGAGPSFDAVAVHPYSFPALPTDVSTASWNTFQALPRLHDLMAAHGDAGKRLWATEVGAPTGNAAISVSEDLQSRIVTSAVAATRGWSWAGPVFLYSVRDSGADPADPEQNFGLLRVDFRPKAAWSALQQLLSTTASSDVLVPTVADPLVAATARSVPPQVVASVQQPAPAASPKTAAVTVVPRAFIGPRWTPSKRRSRPLALHQF